MLFTKCLSDRLELPLDGFPVISITDKNTGRKPSFELEYGSFGCRVSISKYYDFKNMTSKDIDDVINVLKEAKEPLEKFYLFMMELEKRFPASEEHLKAKIKEEKIIDAQYEKMRSGGPDLSKEKLFKRIRFNNKEEV